MVKINDISSFLASFIPPVPKDTKSLYSRFLLKTSKYEINSVLDITKKVLKAFDTLKCDHELCEKCTGFIEHIIKILEEIENSPVEKRDKLIETKEYDDFVNLIYGIEDYLKIYDQTEANQSLVNKSIQKFVLDLEIVINALQRAYEPLKIKKVSRWNPSVISKIRTIGKLMVMKKQFERMNSLKNEKPTVNTPELIVSTRDKCDEEKPSEPIIRTDFIPRDHIISKGQNKNDEFMGTLYEKKVVEKFVEILSKNSEKFAEFKKEIAYLRNLSDECKNILSVKGYTEREVLSDFDKNSSILRAVINRANQWYNNEYAMMLVTECADYNLSNYLKGNKLDWRTKISIARGIANALNFIHSLNLLHYNIKSDSVLLDQNLEPKLYEFGKDADKCVVLKQARSINHSKWSAPEVKRGGKYTSASEVYNFGVILLEISTQECHSEEKSIVNHDAPKDYLSLMEKALDQDPQNRPTMQEMFDSLKQLESSYNVPDKEIPSFGKVMNTFMTYIASKKNLLFDI